MELIWFMTERKCRLVTDNAKVTLNSENARYLSLLKSVEFLENVQKQGFKSCLKQSAKFIFQ